VNARAGLYKESGAFPEEPMDRLRATAYLDILGDIAARDRIAYGRLSPEDPIGDAPTGDAPGGDAPDVPDAADDTAGLGGSDCPCDQCDGRCAPPDDSNFPDDGEPDDGEPDDRGPGNGGPRGGGEPPARGGPGRPGGNAGRPGGNAGRGAGGDAGSAPPAPRPPFPRPPDGPPPTLTDLVLPLATLLGLAERPGEGHGLGALDPALCRALAATAARSPDTAICVTATDPDGIAIGHGCVKPGRLTRSPRGPAPPLAALPARINLTIATARLAALRAQPGTGPPGQRETGWAFARRGAGPPGDPGWCGPWALTLPGGLELTLDLGPVPTLDCDHRNQSHAYQPNATLRHLVQIRDYTCTFPTCNRHARESDFEHAVPYDQGGRTCACNAGARSRKCHRVKQSPGWAVTQPRPAWHQWQTPRGRTYTQDPKRYPI